MLFQWRNFWPFLISSGIQNPVMSGWPSMLGRQPPVFNILLDLTHFLWRGRPMMLGLLCQCMAQSPYQAHRKQCEFCGAEGTSAVVRDADVPRYVVDQSGAKWRVLWVKGPLAKITSQRCHYSGIWSLHTAPLFGQRDGQSCEVIKRLSLKLSSSFVLDNLLIPTMLPVCLVTNS